MDARICSLSHLWHRAPAALAAGPVLPARAGSVKRSRPTEPSPITSPVMGYGQASPSRPGRRDRRGHGAQCKAVPAHGAGSGPRAASRVWADSEGGRPGGVASPIAGKRPGGSDGCRPGGGLSPEARSTVCQHEAGRSLRLSSSAGRYRRASSVWGTRRTPIAGGVTSPSAGQWAGPGLPSHCAADARLGRDSDSGEPGRAGPGRRAFARL